MFEIAGTNNLYFNSVYIGGAAWLPQSNTFAFVSNVTTGTRVYDGQHFVERAQQRLGHGDNYAISLGRAEWSLSNYNDLYATGTNGFVGSFAANA